MKKKIKNTAKKIILSKVMNHVMVGLWLFAMIYMIIGLKANPLHMIFTTILNVEFNLLIKYWND